MGKENMNWGDSFFNEEDVPATTGKEVLDAVNKDTLTGKGKEEPTNPENPENKEKDEMFFGEGGEGAENTDVDDSKTNLQEPSEPEDKEDKHSTSLSILESLKEKGIIDYDEPENGEKLSQEDADDILDHLYDNGVEERVQQLFENMPKEVQALNKFIINGGTWDQFMGVVGKNNSSSFNNIDITKEKDQENVIKSDLINQGYDDEYAETFVQSLKDTGKLKDSAEKVYEKVKNSLSKQRDFLVTQQIQQKKELEQRRSENKRVVSKIVREQDLPIKLSRVEQRTLPDYVSNFNIPLKNGGAITQMQLDLHKAMEDPKKVLILAKILKDDFSFDKIEKALVTKTNKKIQNSLDANGRSAGNKDMTPKKDLAQYFS